MNENKKWIAKWKAENEYGEMQTLTAKFDTKEDAKAYMDGIQESAREICKPFHVISIKKEYVVPYMVKNACGRLMEEGWSIKEINELAGEEVVDVNGVK